MIPELIRAIMKFVPDYFIWNEEQQEEYRIHIPEEDEFNIRQFLMLELFDITVTNGDEMDEAEGHLTEAQWTTINGVMLPLQGIGEDYFFLNESFSKGKSTLSFPTLHDYDFDGTVPELVRRRTYLKNTDRLPFRSYRSGDCRGIGSGEH